MSRLVLAAGLVAALTASAADARPVWRPNQPNLIFPLSIRIVPPPGSQQTWRTYRPGLSLPATVRVVVAPGSQQTWRTYVAPPAHIIRVPKSPPPATVAKAPPAATTTAPAEPLAVAPPTEPAPVVVAAPAPPQKMEVAAETPPPATVAAEPPPAVRAVEDSSPNYPERVFWATLAIIAIGVGLVFYRGRRGPAVGA